MPQQLPGPAQLAWLGEEPQQAVSPGANILVLASPKKDEGAESIFLTFTLPQDTQLTFSFNAATRISLTYPQSKYIVVAINMFRFKRGNCLSVLEIVKKELECNIVYLLR
ncbi:MAG: hypothetical protein GY797_34475 [Deltaproteobacteria bacterium]|nr:hypothetical protein [Deltaproteobacteria bacterium]